MTIYLSHLNNYSDKLGAVSKQFKKYNAYWIPPTYHDISGPVKRNITLNSNKHVLGDELGSRWGEEPQEQQGQH